MVQIHALALAGCHKAGMLPWRWHHDITKQVMTVPANPKGRATQSPLALGFWLMNWVLRTLTNMCEMQRFTSGLS